MEENLRFSTFSFAQLNLFIFKQKIMRVDPSTRLSRTQGLQNRESTFTSANSGVYRSICGSGIVCRTAKTYLPNGDHVQGVLDRSEILCFQNCEVRLSDWDSVGPTGIKIYYIRTLGFASKSSHNSSRLSL